MCSRDASPEKAGDGDVWISLVHVAPGETNASILEPSERAFTNALAWATGPDDFQAQVAEELKEMGLAVLEFEDIGLVSEGSEKSRVEDLAREVAETKEVRFTTFDAYPADENGS
jgi:hypothetical protein